MAKRPPRQRRPPSKQSWYLAKVAKKARKVTDKEKARLGLSPKSPLVAFTKGPLRKGNLVLPERTFNEWKAERGKKTRAAKAKARELRERLSTDIMPVAEYRETAVLPSQRGKGTGKGLSCYIRTGDGGYDAKLAGRNLDLYIGRAAGRCKERTKAKKEKTANATSG
jgi:hypothetical protein